MTELGRWVLTHAGLFTVEEASQLGGEALRDALDVVASSCACRAPVRCTAHRSPPRPLPSCHVPGHFRRVCGDCMVDVHDAGVITGVALGASLVALAGWVQRVESTCDDCGHEPGTHWDGVCWALPGMACDCRARDT